MLSVVENGLDASTVGGEHRLGACGEVDTVSRVSPRFDGKEAAVWIAHRLTSQSKPAIYASSSFSPKHASRTGARCSNLLSNWPPVLEVS